MITKVPLNTVLDIYIYIYIYIYKGNYFPILLCIKLPQMNRYIEYFDNNTYINLLVHDEELLKQIQ